jgi:O-antigen ligase
MFIFGIFGFLTVSGMLYVYLQDSIIFERFFSIGKEAGSIGRLQMWKHFDTAFIENLWGYGAGNSMIAIRAFSDIPLDSPAIHNVYLQTALDLGIFGIICYLTLCILVVLQEFKTNWSCPMGAFIMLYLVASLTQFRGAENLLWFIAGIYIIHSRRTTPSTSQITNEYSTSH